MTTGELPPPQGLLERILRRLGLEKQLFLVKRHLGVVAVFLVLAGSGAVIAVIGIKRMLVHSSFGPYLSLLRSDLGFIVSHRMTYATALFESAPTALIAVSLAALAIVLLCVRFAVVYVQHMSILIKSIHHT